MHIRKPRARRPRTNLRRVCALATAVVGIAGPSAPAQVAEPDAYLRQQQYLERQVWERLDRELPAAQKVDFDWGGWYNFWLLIYDDGLNSSRTVRRNDLRLWADLSLDQGAHEFYVRPRLSLIDFNRGDSYSGNEDDIEGPNLERGWYEFDLAKAMRARHRPMRDADLKLRIGRDLVELGTGYALSLPMDHILLTTRWKAWEVTGLMGRSIQSMDDIERSRPDGGEMERTFWGLQARYLGGKHQPFAYIFWNDDQNNESPENYLQNYAYDSSYVGVGSRGELYRNLRYSTEWVFEQGASYGHRKFMRRDRIQAWAFDFTIEYLSQGRFKPRYFGEYMFASGDADRRFSPTNAVGGNTRGDDNSFVGFGWRDTGLSFAPRLSNVHIWRLGAAFLPFENVEVLRHLELGTDWFLYFKNRQNAAVSDPTADGRDGYLGWEMDYFANWRVTSDLSLTTRYGVFFPGDAFSDQTTRTFLLTGVTWSF